MANITDADHVYVLLTDKYRISRNHRARWFLQHLNKRVHFDPRIRIDDFNDEIDVISYLTTELNSSSGDQPQQQQQQQYPRCFKVTPNTKFTFFSRKYCFVYVVDFSASLANVDNQHSSVLADELFNALAKSLTNLVAPFHIPGSEFLFQPDIFLTILIYNPFYSSDSNNVIIHGYKLCSENVGQLLAIVQEKIEFFVQLLRQNIMKHHCDRTTQAANNKLIVPSDVSLVNMIRFGLLSLNLLPENHQEGIVIVTDGNISFPDTIALESAVAQLRLSMISCSFIHIGSNPHPDFSFGYVPYTDFMKFVAIATFGSYLSIGPDYVCDFEPNSFNVFHQAYLVWNFHYGYSSLIRDLRQEDLQSKIWFIENPYFYSIQEADPYYCRYEQKDQQVFRRKQLDSKISAELLQILSYRLREGFMIKYVNFIQGENSIELTLVLPWRYNINIEYHITAPYHPEGISFEDEDEPHYTNYEVIVEGCYSFHHDVTTSLKKFKSPYRATTIRQFWTTLKNFADSDQLGVHFHNFAKNEVYRAIPESIKNGVPLFYLPPNSNVPVVSFRNDAHTKLSQYWEPICMLDVNMCQKSSLHIHQINILLKHDAPLPEHLYHPNTSCRYDSIQCNQAMSVLNVMLKEWSSFVLLENHSYIKLIDEKDVLSCSFYLIRIISQPPCIVLHLAFIGGTNGALRNQIVNALVQKLRHCKLPQRNLSSSLVQKSTVQIEDLTDGLSSEECAEVSEMDSTNKELNVYDEDNGEEEEEPSVHRHHVNDANCFILLDSPIERMLIRYEKVPKTFDTCYKHEVELKSKSTSHTSINMFQTLTRFLHHKRFIWCTHNSPHTPLLSISAVSRILCELTMKRINEGFHLAYNDCGMVNLVMEVKMHDQLGFEFPCLIQYIIFPSVVGSDNRDSTLDDYDDESGNQNRNNLIVTECWIEPQHGTLHSIPDHSEHYLYALDYKQISNAFYDSDHKLVNSLLTYEHLVAYSLENSHCDSLRNEPEMSTPDEEEPPETRRFRYIPYNFDLFTILDKSKQALLRFSMLFQSFGLCGQTEPEVNSLNNCINIMLYSEFLLKLTKIHDKEIEFSHSDSLKFVQQVNERFSRDEDEEESETEVVPFFNLEPIENDCSILFRCFCKQIHRNCIILTILPATYEVLRKLSQINDSAKVVNAKLVNEIDYDGDEKCYGCLVLPIFVHKLTFEELSRMLQADFDCDVDNSGCNQPNFKVAHFAHLYSSSISNVVLNEEVSRGNFCKSIETLYWNSLTDSVYKSLRYGLYVDQRDVMLVLEKICLKLYEYVEITEFLIYTCKHIQPLLTEYFGHFPQHNIFNLLEYIDNSTRIDSGHNVPSKFISLKNAPFDSTTHCNENGDSLKKYFLSMIHTHFTPIPDIPLNYYFYDYENIQARKFSFGVNDIQKNGEILLRFYQGVENKSINLAQFYEKLDLLEVDTKDNIDEVKKEIKDETQLSENENDMDSLVLLHTKPFFVGFSYTLYLKSGAKLCKSTSLPICILEILRNHNHEDIELEKFRVFLNIEIFTQNLESPVLSKRVSVSSTEASPSSKNIFSIIKQTLDSFQVYKYGAFVEQIEWIIRDEIVSKSHNLFPICPSTLQMVVEHINYTGKSNFSFIDKVELKFVFTIDLEEFRSLLRELKFASFQLCELGEYFYVIHRSTKPESSQTTSEDLDDLPHDSLVAEYEVANTNLSPNFWLILEFKCLESKNYIFLYFHSRQNIYVYGLEIFNQLKRSIEMLCKRMNQKFLLNELSETGECNSLLISAEDKDPFIKSNIRSTLNSTPISQAFLENNFNYNIDNELDLDSFSNSKPLRNFAPGTFMCDVVWSKHLLLHPRLYSKDRIGSIKTVLSSFKVANRNNLYVYREKSGSVFYFRIYEMECTKHVYAEGFNYSDSTMAGQCDNPHYYDNIINTGDLLYNSDSVKFDSDKDNDSITSQSVNRSMEKCSSQQCVLLNVHGISEPGLDIKKGMVDALQKKLDEAVLDMLVFMLARNPHAKLSPEDVCFIQGCNSSFDNYYFMINEHYLPYVVNIKAYIRQNLSTFMYNPKYLDSQLESHLKIFKNDEFYCVRDEDVFIFHCQQESGKDHKGIACVILSIVSKEKLNPIPENGFHISHSDLSDLVSGNFEHITYCYCHERENEHVKFYINFQVWFAGKVDVNFLDKKLIESVKNALWDFNLEFKIFKLCDLEEHRSLHSVSEPSTPKKLPDKRERRTGLSVITGCRPSVTQIEDGSFFTTAHLLKGPEKPATASVVEISGDTHFDFGNIDLNLESADRSEQAPFYQKNRELACLSHKLNIVVKPWLDFGKEISVASLRKFQFPVILKSSIRTVVKEFNLLIKNLCVDMKIHFLPSSGPFHSDFDHNIYCEEGNNFVLLIRNEDLWNARSLSDAENSFTFAYSRMKNEASKLNFPPLFQSKFDNNFTNNLSGVDVDSFRCVVARQKFLLLHSEDRYITLYMYNWSSQFGANILSKLSHLIVWHNSRSLLLQSLILQKAGILHNYPFKRYSFEAILNISNVLHHYLTGQPQSSTSAMSKDTQNLSKIFKDVDLLLKYTNPYDAFQEAGKSSAHTECSSIILDVRNSDYIFSDFNDSDRKVNLFACLNGQFNSPLNVYIKELKDLSKVCQIHGTKLNYVTMDKITRLVKNYGRLSHYCLTPFMFSPKWRYIISLVRDYTFPVPQTRPRHMSGGHLNRPLNSEFTVRSRRKSGPPNMAESGCGLIPSRSPQDELLDKSVCPHYIQEYIQYLQSLGFSAIKSKKLNGMKKDGEKLLVKPKPGIVFNRKSIHEQKSEEERFFLIKTLPGGFYLFEIGFSEPYVYSYLYSFDSKRFASWNKCNISEMSITTFLDELDSIKVRMHLHSFTYDYHLRAIHSYISGRKLFFHLGYHLISFLDDFIKYYQKAPNYARNQIYLSFISFESNRIKADQLYNHIIGKNKFYGMEVIRMDPLKHETNKEYLLIKMSSHQVPYSDENKIKQEDNFDVGVLVSHYKDRELIAKDNVLYLKFFVLLTSQRELFPKLCTQIDSRGQYQAVRFSPSLSRRYSLVSQDSFQSNYLLVRPPCSVDEGSGLPKIEEENINYLGYYNSHEIAMLNILEEKVDHTKRQLLALIELAEIDCRRDFLWASLMRNTNSPESVISVEELNELLSLVKSIRIDEYDSSLKQFYSFNYQWYKRLAQKLELKFDSTHRKFTKENSLKMAFFKQDKTNFQNCFILFHLTPTQVELKIVFKERPDTVVDSDFLENCHTQYHELVEDFVNACTSHLWSLLM